MKVGLIYTSTTPELIELVEQEVKKQLGDDVELYSLQDPRHSGRCSRGRLCDHCTGSTPDRHVHESR